MQCDNADEISPSIKDLIENHVASRIQNNDASVYDFSKDAFECAQNFMGWTDLASNPQYSLEEIEKFAERQRNRGIDTVVLIGQGGSTQAAMTLTKYNKVDSQAMRFRTLDSDSPVRVRSFLTESDPHKTLVIISSKSGTTLEPRMIARAVCAAFAEELPQEELPKHLVAITDPGSALADLALNEGWEALFLGKPSVGGRYSALSVFGLVPAALVGIDIKALIEGAEKTERICGMDSVENPAIQLAAFLYDNYLQGRNKFSILTPRRGRVIGLWIEQLIAESLGKEGKGILPNIEIDALMLSDEVKDRTVIMYQTKTDLWDERMNFEKSLSYVHPSIPKIHYSVNSVDELARHFVVWEYATALCGYLMKVCPFDQPDVASAKSAVLDILDNGAPEPDFVENGLGRINNVMVEVRVSNALPESESIFETLTALFKSIEPGDYFALNAFLPFDGEGRRGALETIRHAVAEKCGVVSCLEVGPRYLHSTGQLQKGGPNNGVYLIVSADEMKDIPLQDSRAASLGTLAKAQAMGDLVTLASRGRRCVHIHLPDHSGATLRCLAEVVNNALNQAQAERRNEKSL